MTSQEALRPDTAKEAFRPDITVIGAAIIDVLARPVTPELFSKGSVPVEEMRLSFGGDAMNESVVLSRLGKRVSLISEVGDDAAGRSVLGALKQDGVDVSSVRVMPGLPTGMNIVLTDPDGERYFLTDPHGSLRSLSKETVLAGLKDAAGIVSFASLFVSSALGIPDYEELFRTIKERPGRILALDTTRRKHGETLKDLSGFLPYIDYFFPNLSEIRALTGLSDPYDNARALLDAGVGCALIKTGALGAIVADKNGIRRIPAYPVPRCVDSTGAGDTFAAGFLCGLSNGLSPDDCACFGNACASVTVETLGATDGVRDKELILSRFRYLQDQRSS